MTFISGRLSRHWQETSRAEIAWLLFSALVFWAAKSAGRFLEGVPGHAAAFWVPALFLARAAVPRPGAGTVTALLGGALSSLPGGSPVGLAGYVAAGLALDLLVPRSARLRWLPLALLGGTAASLAKFSFHNVPAAVLGAGGHFMTWGLLPVAGLHFVFGLLGGFLGWLIARRFARRGPSTGD